jgi:Domain of unknown function (DUF4350)
MSATQPQGASTTKPRREPLSKNAWVIIIAAALMLGLGIYAAFNWFQIVDDEVTVGAEGEAATNPYLALERLLVASGSAVTRSNKSGEFDKLLSANSQPVMILGDRRLAQMRAERVAQLAAWVQAGGHLIVEAEQPELEDPVLEYWGIDRKRLVWRAGKNVEVDRRKPINEDVEEPDESTSPKPDEASATDGVSNDTSDDVKSRPAPADDMPADDDKSAPAIAPTNNQLRQDADKPDVDVQPNRDRDGKQTRTTRFNFSAKPEAKKTSITLSDGLNFSARFLPYQNVALKKLPAQIRDNTMPRHLITDREGGRMVELGHGQGKVTVISNFDFMTWRSLRVDDHAELIWHLVSEGNSKKPAVVLAVYPQGDGFWTWMTTHAWMVAVSGLVLLLVWLWRVIPRMGPLAPVMTNNRRSLSEHVGAAGRFLAARNQWQSMIQPVRSRVIAQMKRRHPRTAMMSDAEQVRYLSTLMAVNEDDVMRILFIPVASRHECLYAITQLIHLSRKL